MRDLMKSQPMLSAKLKLTANKKNNVYYSLTTYVRSACPCPTSNRCVLLLMKSWTHHFSGYCNFRVFLKDLVLSLNSRRSCAYVVQQKNAAYIHIYMLWVVGVRKKAATMFRKYSRARDNTK